MSRTSGKFLRLLAAVVLVATTFSEATDAGVISADDAVFGTDSIVIDTDTGLEWLDWSKSSGHTNGTNYTPRYLDILADQGTGGTFDGWRHASLDELNTFMTNLGFTQFGSFYNDGGVAALNAETLLGYTNFSNSHSSQSYLYYLDPAGTGDAAPIYTVQRSGDYSLASGATSGTGNANDGYSAYGHALVRSSAVATVPEPVSLAMWSLGMIGWVSTRRRRR